MARRYSWASAPSASMTAEVFMGPYDISIMLVQSRPGPGARGRPGGKCRPRARKHHLSLREGPRLLELRASHRVRHAPRIPGHRVGGAVAADLRRERAHRG